MSTPSSKTLSELLLFQSELSGTTKTPIVTTCIQDVEKAINKVFSKSQNTVCISSNFLTRNSKIDIKEAVQDFLLLENSKIIFILDCGNSTENLGTNHFFINMIYTILIGNQMKREDKVQTRISFDPNSIDRNIIIGDGNMIWEQTGEKPTQGKFIKGSNRDYQFIQDELIDNTFCASH